MLLTAVESFVQPNWAMWWYRKLFRAFSTVGGSLQLYGAVHSYVHCSALSSCVKLCEAVCSSSKLPAAGWSCVDLNSVINLYYKCPSADFFPRGSRASGGDHACEGHGSLQHCMEGRRPCHLPWRVLWAVALQGRIPKGLVTCLEGSSELYLGCDL